MIDLPLPELKNYKEINLFKGLAPAGFTDFDPVPAGRFQLILPKGNQYNISQDENDICRWRSYVKIGERYHAISQGEASPAIIHPIKNYSP